VSGAVSAGGGTGRAPHRIVVVGGGAGGLELATRLGHGPGRAGRAHVTLVDPSLTHLWKPLLHEVAAGTLDSHDDDLDFLAHAHRHGFAFRLGAMTGLDRERRVVRLAPVPDADGEPIGPPREVPYDTVVIAVGSVTDDFGVPGVREHCRFLDTRAQADAFQHALLSRFLRAQIADPPPPAPALTVAIVGGGATGVELAAELHHVAHRLVAYGFDRIDPKHDVHLVLVEAADRLLPAAAERVSSLAERELRELGVEVRTGTRITEVTRDGLVTGDGDRIPAGTCVWAAGIRGPEGLAGVDLERDRAGRLVVRETLQTTGDAAVFALGDCAACPWPGGPGGKAPPTAQVAHQQALLLARSLGGHLRGRPLLPFTFQNYGAMVSLSEYTAVGTLMGNLLGRVTGSVMIEGWIARMTYRLLYRKHQRALHGTPRTALMMLADWISHRVRTRLKLH
jgi:NADH dehydrogenase